MTWLTILELVLQIASAISQRVAKADAERAFANALTNAMAQRVDAADAARDDVLSHGLPDLGADDNNRDNRPTGHPDV